MQDFMNYDESFSQSLAISNDEETLKKIVNEFRDAKDIIAKMYSHLTSFYDERKHKYNNIQIKNLSSNDRKKAVKEIALANHEKMLQSLRVSFGNDTVEKYTIINYVSGLPYLDFEVRMTVGFTDLNISSFDTIKSTHFTIDEIQEI